MAVDDPLAMGLMEGPSHLGADAPLQMLEGDDSCAQSENRSMLPELTPGQLRPKARNRAETDVRGVGVVVPRPPSPT